VILNESGLPPNRLRSAAMSVCLKPAFANTMAHGRTVRPWLSGQGLLFVRAIGWTGGGFDF